MFRWLPIPIFSENKQELRESERVRWGTGREGRSRRGLWRGRDRHCCHLELERVRSELLGGESGTSWCWCWCCCRCHLKAMTLGLRNSDCLANPSNAAPQTFFGFLWALFADHFLFIEVWRRRRRCEFFWSGRRSMSKSERERKEGFDFWKSCGFSGHGSATEIGRNVGLTKIPLPFSINLYKIQKYH